VENWKTVCSCAFKNRVGGRGCIVRYGFMVHRWGSQTQHGQWASAQKALTSYDLGFAVEEGLLNGVHDLVARWGLPLRKEHCSMTFFHLACMLSEYALPHESGSHFAYNDYAVRLYNETLYKRVLGVDYDDVGEMTDHFEAILGVLGCEDGDLFAEARGTVRLNLSIRDMARFGWLLANKFAWRNEQLLPREFFEHYWRAHVPAGFPVCSDMAPDDYLGIGTWGGGVNQHSSGSGYGFNCWHNLLPDGRLVYPDGPCDAFFFRGNRDKFIIVVPSLALVAVVYGGTNFSTSSQINRTLQMLQQAVVSS
jgi:CubicO group peptidase (beta-lactamase class C family)